MVCLCGAELVAQSVRDTSDLQTQSVGASSNPQNLIEAEVPSLSQALADNFVIGAAIWKGDLSGPHSELLKKHFNSITPENDLKWARLRPTEDAFDFTSADALVAFAKANHMRVRGHTLAWHKQNPAWLFKDASGNNLQPSAENKTLVLKRLEKHIRGVVSHYKDDVYAWDVVNEVIDPDQPDGFRRSPWFLLTGTDYIDTAFRTAREVAPHAKLFINEYDTTKPVKRGFLYTLVRDLKARGVPIDGVGHQMHIHLAEPSVAEIRETIQLFSELRLDNQITELDISLYANNVDRCASIPQEILVEQGYRYHDIFATLRELRGKVSGVTFWGVADDHTWLKTFPVARLNLPLLFDEQSRAKPAYWGIVEPSRLPSRPSSASTSLRCTPLPGAGPSAKTPL